MLRLVDWDELPSVLYKAKPYIERALSYNTLPIKLANVFQDLMACNSFLFLMEDSERVRGAVVVHVYQEHDYKVMNIYLLSHDEDYGDEDTDLAELEEYARKAGVQYLQYVGRMGFARRNRKNWDVSQVIMTRKL